MKKLLTILGAVGLTATAGATVVACGQDPEKPPVVKGDFDVKADATGISAGATTFIEIKDFENVSKKWKNFKVTSDAEKWKETIEIIGDFAEDGIGRVDVKGLKVGSVKLYVTAEKVEEEPKESTFDEAEKPVEPAAKSNVVEITITAEDLGLTLSNKLVLGEMTQADAEAKVKEILEESHFTDKVNIDKTKVADGKGSIKVTAKKELKDTLIGEATFTFTVKE